jgi:hypothetical protein
MSWLPEKPETGGADRSLSASSGASHDGRSLDSQAHVRQHAMQRGYGKDSKATVSVSRKISHAQMRGKL